MMLLVCLLCLFAIGTSLPIVISRNGGRSRRRRAAYLLEEKKRVATCCTARMVNPDIKIGQCPNVIREYKHLYTRDSVSFLKDYYTCRCDIVYVKPSYIVGQWFVAFLGISCMLSGSFAIAICVIGLAMEAYGRLWNSIRCITFPLNPIRKT